jgi:hypothetical protein
MRPSDVVAIAVAALAVSAANARASVSVTVTLDDLVQRASAAALVLPIEQRSVWEEGRIATYTHLHVERFVAGRLPDEIWVRAFGGAVGRIGQLVEGEASFTSGVESLVFLHPHTDGPWVGTFGVVEGAQGQFPVVTSRGSSPRLDAARGLGGLLPPPKGASPLARDVLLDHSLEDAAREIGKAWSRLHAEHEAP